MRAFTPFHLYYETTCYSEYHRSRGTQATKIRRRRLIFVLATSRCIDTDTLEGWFLHNLGTLRNISWRGGTFSLFSAAFAAVRFMALTTHDSGILRTYRRRDSFQSRIIIR